MLKQRMARVPPDSKEWTLQGCSLTPKGIFKWEVFSYTTRIMLTRTIFNRQFRTKRLEVCEICTNVVQFLAR